MRRASTPSQPPPELAMALEERLYVTAQRLARLPEQVASLSITTGWQGHREADVRTIARAVAAASGQSAAVEADGDVVTVRFVRAAGAPERAH